MVKVFFAKGLNKNNDNSNNAVQQRGELKMKEEEIEKEISFIKSNFYTLYQWIESLEIQLNSLKEVLDELQKKEVLKKDGGRKRNSGVHKLS